MIKQSVELVHITKKWSMFQSKFRLARIPKVYIKMMDGFYKFGIQRELKDLKNL